MSKAKEMAIRAFFERHGFKLVWFARALEMSEELFRHHIARGFQHGDIADRVKALIRAHARAVLEDLDELPDSPPKPDEARTPHAGRSDAA